MTPTDAPVGARTARRQTPPTTDEMRRHAAIVLIAVGLDTHDHPSMPRDIAEAIGLLPTTTAHPRIVTLTHDRPAIPEARR